MTFTYTPTRWWLLKNVVQATGVKVDACNAILTSVQPDTILWSSDEVHVHLSGSGNKQHFRDWTTETHRELHQRLLYIPKVTVWCAVSSEFFELLKWTSLNLEVQLLQWTLCAIVKCWRNVSSPKLQSTLRSVTQKPFGANRMVPRLIPLAIHAKLYQNNFPAARSPYEGMFHGPLTPRIWSPNDFLYWDTSKLKVTKFEQGSWKLLRRQLQMTHWNNARVLRRVSENIFQWLAMCIARQGDIILRLNENKMTLNVVFRNKKIV